jgi:hypothetical protein
MMGIGNAIRDYVRCLHEVNGRLIIVSSYDAIRDKGEDVELISVISQLIRLIPVYKKNGILMINNNDGLLEYGDEFEFLSRSFTSLLDEHYLLIDKLRDVRNKYQHKLHGNKHYATSSDTSSLLTIYINIDNKDLIIECKEIISLLMDLNLIYDKLLKLIIKKYYSDNLEGKHLYYEHILGFDFLNYNKVLSMKELKIIGQIFKPFYT